MSDSHPEIRTRRAGSRRRWPARGLIALALIAAGGLAACNNDPVGPGKGSVVWIAQSFSGRVTTVGAVQNPIPGATVTFLAGFHTDGLIPLATTVTKIDGTFSLSKAEISGTAGDFWWFSVGDNAPVKIYTSVQAKAPGYEPGQRISEALTRVPSREPPARGFEAYQLAFTVQLQQPTPP